LKERIKVNHGITRKDERGYDLELYTRPYSYFDALGEKARLLEPIQAKVYS
jgi:hypothetical protein